MRLMSLYWWFSLFRVPVLFPQNLNLELATMGDLKLVERPQNHTLGPGAAKTIRANIKVRLSLSASSNQPCKTTRWAQAPPIPRQQLGMCCNTTTLKLHQRAGRPQNRKLGCRPSAPLSAYNRT